MSILVPSLTRQPVPQSGRIATITPLPMRQNLWQHLLATLSEVGNMLDPFANDAHRDVRRLGRAIRQRYPQLADDYFALGDMCARLTLEGPYISQVYAEKAIMAYQRASECAAHEAYAAQTMILRFLAWITEVASTINTLATLQNSLAICEYALRVEPIASDNQATALVRTMYSNIHAQLTRIQGGSVLLTGLDDMSPERLSRQLCDEGQELLRRHNVAEALDVLSRAVACDEQNSKAWLWQALALTDIARFDEAIACYDQAIRLDPSDYGAWNSRGALLLELGRVDEAIQCFDQALAMPLAPAVVQAAFLLNKGKGLYIQANYQEARLVLEQSNALDPTPESMSGITACTEMIGRIHSRHTYAPAE